MLLLQTNKKQMQQQRTVLNYLTITLKGIAMGAADVVPGVSGGTIAFIAGIYEELLESISSFNLSLLKLLKQGKLKTIWKKVNGNFLTALLIGIFISIVSLAKLISWLLENHPILLWSFFFGLVLASVLYIGKQITKWNKFSILLFLIGVALAYYITTLEPLVTQNSSPIFLFLSGALAICAMILPGISGSFILVLLGAYQPILEAIHTKNLKTIAIVGIGAVVGLLSFSKLLKWLFTNYKNYTLVLLTGFILGSLNKIWPWKKVIKTQQIEDKIITLKEASISPLAFEGNPQILFAVLLMALGFITIIALEKIAHKKN